MTDTIAPADPVEGPAELTWQELFELPARHPRPEVGETCAAIGWRNPWIKGAYDPPFTAASIRLCQSRYELRRWLEFGNWCNGSAFAVDEGDATLCFIQQGECSDEWLVVKFWPDGEHLAFESISWHYILTRKADGVAHFHEMLDRLFAATPEQCRTYSY